MSDLFFVSLNNTSSEKKDLSRKTYVGAVRANLQQEVTIVNPKAEENKQSGLAEYPPHRKLSLCFDHVQM